MLLQLTLSVKFPVDTRLKVTEHVCASGKPTRYAPMPFWCQRVLSAAYCKKALGRTAAQHACFVVSALMLCANSFVGKAQGGKACHTG